MLTTYTTLDHDVLDISALTAEEAAFLEVARAKLSAGEPWADFSNWAFSNANPTVQPGARITRETAVHPLYRAVRDLADRIGIAQGELRSSPGDDLERDPFADDVIAIAEAAAIKHVTMMAVRKAINRGDLVAVGGRPLRVSRNSLDQWAINHARQAAGAARSA